MRSVTLRRFGLTVAMLATGLLVAAVPASAESNTGSAGLGSAHFTKGAVSISVPTQAACVVDTPVQNVTMGIVAKKGIIFGGGKSTCKRTVVDPDNEVSSIKSEAIGNNFELSALVSLNGPRIKLAGYQASCLGTQGQTSASWGISGLIGLTGLPNPIQTGYVHQVKKANSAIVLATITFGEVTTSNLDGSLALSALHIRFTNAPDISGDVILGKTACGPTP